ncbi:protein kinase-like protein [Umezawaea tangerina]|uniref:Protein kinase-like protein n=2 Tax=Umezawaea tangerina TaxID=84725 RepID=A0A2T0TK48_9PSEU|nr:protein kinase-like protein [Umezawaea tangerina]
MPIWWLGNGFVWLGGASWRGVRDRHDRSSYQLSGLFVLLNGVIAWGLFTLAAVGMGVVPDFGTAAPYTAVWGLFIAAFDRAIASKPADPNGKARGAFSYVVRGLCACLIGFIIAEAGALAIFHDDVERTMRDTISQQVTDSRVLVVGTDGNPNGRMAELKGLKADRAKLDTDVAAAQAEADRTRRLAACERDPRGCQELVQSGEITGAGGDGDKTAVRDSEHAAAEAKLTEAKTALAAQSTNLDDRIAELDGKLTADLDTAQAAAKASDGVPARWRAMLDFTTRDTTAMFMHWLIVIFCVLLDLIPLLLKIWRGRTGYDMTVMASRERREREITYTAQRHRESLDRVLARERIDQSLDVDLARLRAESSTKIEAERQRLWVEAEFERLGTEPPSIDMPSQRGNPPVSAQDRPADPPPIPDDWTDEDRELIGHLFDERFRAVEPLEGADRGAFGRMLMGRDLQTNERVVIKAVRDADGDNRLVRRSPLRRMWQREVDAARRLDNANIGQIITSGVESGYLWTVSPLYSPGSLVHWITKTAERGGDGYTLQHSIDHIRQLTRALVYAHSENVTHGDIKPTNAVLDGPTLVLVDWGFARLLNQTEDTGAVGGTPMYTAPEVLLRASHDPELADLYSVGATWYFLLTGRPPYQHLDQGSGAKEIAKQIQDGASCTRLDELLPDLPEAVVQLVHNLISVFPNRRVEFDGDDHPAKWLERAISRIATVVTTTDQGSMPVGPGALGARRHTKTTTHTIIESSASALLDPEDTVRLPKPTEHHEVPRTALLDDTIPSFLPAVRVEDNTNN